ncbi:hypothetical protein [Luteolibacter marinus]|uniref:hypothetical protein n=1 Tax=Luteolibacter marinus TaxID=2776705 RepID=UPI0018670896|nr:hypothetical protein [Luteolibacter marinus]
MNPGDDSEFERQLLQMELRRPPAEWKALLLPEPLVPWFPKPLLAGLAACWAVIGGLALTTPDDLLPDQPLMLPPGGAPFGDTLMLGTIEPDPLNR